MDDHEDRVTKIKRLFRNIIIIGLILLAMVVYAINAEFSIFKNDLEKFDQAQKIDEQDFQKEKILTVDLKPEIKPDPTGNPAPTISENVVIKSFTENDAYYLELLLTSYKLEKTVFHGGDINALVADLKFLSAGDEFLKKQIIVLEGYKDKKLLSNNELVRIFKVKIKEIIATENEYEDQKQVQSKFANFMKDIIIIRKTGENAYNSTGVDGIIERASRYFDNNDLAKAAAELDKLSDHTKEVHREYFEDLKAKIMVQESAQKLMEYVAAKIYKARTNV